MKSFSTLLIIAACLSMAMALRMRRAYNPDDDDIVDLSPTVNQTIYCITKNGTNGFCVHESMCTNDHVFQEGGIIDDSEIRKRNDSQCLGKYDWCCSYKNATSLIQKPDRSNLPISGCRTVTKNWCPWCVALYRDGGHPRTKSPTGLFCGGAVIGSRIVLTAANCVLAASTSNLWVQLPGSTQKYFVNRTAEHPQFGSGTREHDTALLIMNEDIAWPEGRQDGLGACLGLRTPLEGDCTTVGFDKNDQLEFTQMSVKVDGCTQEGSVYDAACGRSNGSCSVALGSPVLCPSDVEGLLVAGIVRQKCVKGAVLLGSLVQSAEWLREELTKHDIAAKNYTI